MSQDESKKRRYSEEEFALILRKASEIQESPGDRGQGGGGGGGGGGFSLEEIQSIAQEAGIDPGAVTRAASLLGTLDWEEKKGLAAAIFGGSDKFHMDSEIPGRLPPEEVGRILEAIRRAAEHQGEATEVLGGVEWKTIGELSIINVNISPRGDRTSIQIVGNRGPAGALTFAMPMVGALVMTGILGASFEPTAPLAIAGLVGGTLGTGFLTARTLFVSNTKKFKKRLTRIMDRLTEAVETTALPPGSEESETP